MNDADVKAVQLLEVEPGTRLVCKVENKLVRLLVPATFRCGIFDTNHRRVHPG